MHRPVDRQHRRGYPCGAHVSANDCLQQRRVLLRLFSLRETRPRSAQCVTAAGTSLRTPRARRRAHEVHPYPFYRAARPTTNPMQLPLATFPASFRFTLLTSLLAALALPAPAQNNAGGPGQRGATPAQQAAQRAAQQATRADHENIKEQLGIIRLRPGRNGNPNATNNPANYDPAKANPYPDLPELLVAKNGLKITTADQWWQLRRPEIVEDFEREVIGRVAKDVPKVIWSISTQPDRATLPSLRVVSG